MPASNAPCALVVEDHPILLMDVCDILEEAGFRCLAASNADRAKAILPEHGDRIVLFFSDVDMPGDTDGFALARHVAEGWPHIEIVIASGRVTPGDGDMPDKATFIRKPFSAAMVYHHLQAKLPDDEMPEPLRHAI